MRTVHVLPMVLFVFMLVLAGCPAVPDLPESLDVAISATDKRNVPRDSGPEALANSGVAGFRKADPNAPDDAALPDQPAPGPYGGLLNGGILTRPPVDQQMFIADFGPAGQMTSIRENLYFLPDIYGEQVTVSAEWLPGTLPLMQFRSASYGLQADDRIGVAVLVQVQLAGAYVGRAVIYTWGALGEDRIDGTFGYLLDFSGGIAEPLSLTGGDQYPFYAVRVP